MDRAKLSCRDTQWDRDIDKIQSEEEEEEEEEKEEKEKEANKKNNRKSQSRVVSNQQSEQM